VRHRMITVRRNVRPVSYAAGTRPKVSRSLPSVRWLLDKGRGDFGTSLPPTGPKRGLLRTQQTPGGCQERGERCHIVDLSRSSRRQSVRC
jgi:hypothetical protein